MDQPTKEWWIVNKWTPRNGNGSTENDIQHPKCGHEPFGTGGGEAMCAGDQVPFLGALPLDIRDSTEVDKRRAHRDR